MWYCHSMHYVRHNLNQQRVSRRRNADAMRVWRRVERIKHLIVMHSS
jgi:hypothetical protein